MTDTVDGDLDLAPEFLQLDERLEATRADDVIEQINAPVGDDTLPLRYRLPTGKERMRVMMDLPLSELQSLDTDTDYDSERFADLQQQDDLTDKEEAELREYYEQELTNVEQVLSALGDDGLNALWWLAKQVVLPPVSDVDDVMGSPEKQRQLFDGDIPTRLQAADVRDALADVYAAKLDQSPYPTLFTIGMQALSDAVDISEGN